MGVDKVSTGGVFGKKMLKNLEISLYCIVAGCDWLTTGQLKKSDHASSICMLTIHEETTQELLFTSLHRIYLYSVSRVFSFYCLCYCDSHERQESLQLAFWWQ